MPNTWAEEGLERLEQEQAKESEAASAEVVPDDAANQTLQNAESKKTSSEVDAKTVVKAPDPNTDPVKDADYWIKKSKELEAEVDAARAVKQKRDHDLEVGLHGALQAKSKLEQERDTLLAELNEKKAELTKINSSKPFELPGNILEEVGEFPEVQSAIVKAVSFANRQAEEKFNRELEAIKTKLQDATKSVETDKRAAFIAAHFAQVKAKHADAADYFDPEKLGGAIKVWAKETQPPVVSRILDEAANFDPEDVVSVLENFKKAISAPGKKNPVPGDAASKLGHDAAPMNDGSEEYLTDEEMDNFDFLMSEAIRTKTLDDLLKRVENTQNRKLRSK